MDYLNVSQVISIHQNMIDQTGDTPGIRDRGLLESAVLSPETGYYASIVEELAALIESMFVNHPSVDGNKRTAMDAADTFLRMNGHSLRIAPYEAVEFIITLFEFGTFRFDHVVRWLTEHIDPSVST